VETATRTYYFGLLFHVGCTADAEVAADIFPGDGALLTDFFPVMFGSPREQFRGIRRALASPGAGPLARAGQVARGLPRAAGSHKAHLEAACQVGQMLSDRLGVPMDVKALFPHLAERWDGKGEPGDAKGEQVPLALRICHVARDATVQQMVGGDEHAVRTLRNRAGAAFDPDIANLLADDWDELLAAGASTSAWDEALASEPAPHLTLEGDAIDRALGAMGDFADLASPYLVGHSAGVADLAAAAAEQCHFGPGDAATVRRAALVHDVGRVAVPVRIWQKSTPLTPDDWERVRLHAYHTERILSRSPFLAALAPVATAHHERLDGGGYHRGTPVAGLSPPARLLAAADAFHAMTEPRPHRAPLPPERAAEDLDLQAHAGRLDADAVAAVLEAAGQRRPHAERPAGLTGREAQVVGLLARGLQTKQVAHVLGISTKTADRHIQNSYAKIGVSTRAAAALFAMQHGLAGWGELPMGTTVPRS
jgi:HD-GYP domain-containing protein (c-di-GMP phosphodiesterase class II)